MKEELIICLMWLLFATFLWIVGVATIRYARYAKWFTICLIACVVIILINTAAIKGLGAGFWEKHGIDAFLLWVLGFVFQALFILGVGKALRNKVDKALDRHMKR